ncbi:MAG: hypothetical protein KBC69_00650 [Candidatus Magasanikbacteria bacterium]|nr:hypothetical protein [Candidatus Magasanikbacteria bacterium]
MKKIFALPYIFILSLAIWSTPVLADTTTTPVIIDETITSTPSIDPVPTPSSTVIVRYQDRIILNSQILLTSTIYHDQINNLDYPLATPTVFLSLVLADQQNEAFTISDAQYNQDYNSFYLSCLALPTASSTENACYNWNYIVDNNYPTVGMDKYTLTGGETIYIYFSNPWQITASTSTFQVGTTTTLQTWRYQFENLIEPWTLDGNNLVSISIPNPNPTGWWDQTIPVTTTQTNASGTVDYIFTTTGTYYAQITSLDFSKWSNPITLLVQENTPPTSTTEQPPSGGGSGSGSTAPSISNSEITSAVQKILNFLKSKQSADGSILDLATSDWSAMSFGANTIYTQDIKTSTLSLYDYLNTSSITSGTDTLNTCTEYPRHILGLLSAGFAKTNTQIIDLKNKITTECLTESLVGQPGINDDIFIVLALLATDESPSSQIISAAINAITADQQTDGSFTWNGYSGQDVTGAAINALRYASTFGISINNTVFEKAKNYLHTTQLTDGGWTGYGTVSDALTTSWAMYGINSLNEGQAQWTNAQGNNPWTVLTTQLTADGYYSSPWSADHIDWFGTKHAIPALLGKSWPIVLAPAATPSSGGTGGGTTISEASTSSSIVSIITTTTVATTTPETTTTTQLISTENTDNFGEILGIKIESEKPVVIAATLSPENTETIVSPQNSNNNTTSTSVDTNEQYTEAAPDESTQLPAPRNWARILLILSLAGIALIGIFVGAKQLKK